ncbi:hypothetical protein [Nitrosophilus alvini]|uniref:hypothetical protein n=1 Tax=Nitrosophilus alvini TaxID=2714855 RepID=UPI00190C4D45|nr:hypothetical protein [Nitrosophilus alvini]
MKAIVIITVFFTFFLYADTKSVVPQKAKWVDIILEGKECSVEIKQANRYAEGTIKSSSGRVERMAIIMKNPKGFGKIHVKSNCKIVKIDYSKNAVGSPVKKIKNRELWEWKKRKTDNLK